MDNNTAPKKRGRPKLPEGERKGDLPDHVRRQMQVDAEESGGGYGKPTGDDGFRYLDSVCDIRDLPSVDLDNPDEVRERVNWYFRHCRDKKIKLSVAGLASALRVDRKTLCKWTSGATRKDQPHGDIIKMASQDILYALEGGAMDGDIDRVIAIFLLKNHGGYTDAQQITVDSKAPEFEECRLDDVLSAYSGDAHEDDIQ